MKKFIKFTLPTFGRACSKLCFGTAIIILLTINFLTINFSFAQTPPPPNGNGGAPSGNNTPVGGGAPIGGGLLILVALGAGYGAKKVYAYRYKKLAE